MATVTELLDKYADLMMKLGIDTAQPGHQQLFNFGQACHKQRHGNGEYKNEVERFLKEELPEEMKRYLFKR